MNGETNREQKMNCIIKVSNSEEAEKEKIAYIVYIRHKSPISPYYPTLNEGNVDGIIFSKEKALLEKERWDKHVKEGKERGDKYYDDVEIKMLELKFKNI